MKNSKTIVEMYEQILANYALTTEEVDFLNDRIAIAQKKNSSRKNELTETQKENLAIADEILAYMNGKTDVTIAQIRKNFDLSPQKVTPIMTSLVDNGKVIKTVEKRVSYFNLV